MFQKQHITASNVFCFWDIYFDIRIFLRSIIKKRILFEKRDRLVLRKKIIFSLFRILSVENKTKQERRETREISKFVLAKLASRNHIITTGEAEEERVGSENYHVITTKGGEGGLRPKSYHVIKERSSRYERSQKTRNIWVFLKKKFIIIFLYVGKAKCDFSKNKRI